MHQAILTHAETAAGAQPPLTGHPFRVRSLAAIDAAPTEHNDSKVPVIEAYGMTEARNQIASNPLPPLARKPGSVGMASQTTS